MYFLFLSMLMAVPVEDFESRTLFEENVGGKQGKWRVMISDRRVAGDGSISFHNRDVNNEGDISFGILRFNNKGEPLSSLQEGSWGKLESEFAENSVTRTIEGKKLVSDQKQADLVNPTRLWFWKVQPKVGETVDVTIASANVPGTTKLRFTYEGLEEIEAAGKKVNAHKVKEVPLDANGKPTIALTYWWYDNKGMGIQRYHKVGDKFENWYKLKSWR